jgi:hypothetical protein
MITTIGGSARETGERIGEVRRIPTHSKHSELGSADNTNETLEALYQMSVIESW